MELPPLPSIRQKCHNHQVAPQNSTGMGLEGPWGWRDTQGQRGSGLERQDLPQGSGFPFGMLNVLSRNIPEKSVYLPPENINTFCHSKVTMGNIFPEEEEEEGEQEQTSQKAVFFCFTTSLNFYI